MNEDELIETDYDGLKDCEILVLLIVDGESPVSRSRLQRLAQLYRNLYETEMGENGLQ